MAVIINKLETEVEQLFNFDWSVLEKVGVSK